LASNFKPTATQRALYAEHVHPRTDGGLPLLIEDHLTCLDKAARLGVSDADLARSLGVPVAYVRALRATLAG
jgi:hypothetical protein